MKKYFVAFLFFIYSILEFSQFITDFSDRDFVNSPLWLADIEGSLTSDEQDLNGNS